VNRFTYYEEMKGLARQIRSEYGLTTPRVRLSDLRRIYHSYKIKIDLWPHKFKTLRGAYFHDELGATVMIAKELPDEPKIFTMAHELKHHLKDQELKMIHCGTSNVHEHIEIGAEVFAAELIFPEQDFKDCMLKMGITRFTCTPDRLVHLKKKTQTTLSYAGLSKRAQRLEYAANGSFDNIKWKILEEKIYGEPAYKQIIRYRKKQKLQ
jgi:Zn-dependent peptidase ImmA (M78 family)